MPSYIYYRFKSYKDFSSVAFEGANLPLWELKYEIVTQRKMNSKDFDLLFFDDETNEQILDEYAQVARNSHIVVQRIPSWMSKTGFQLRERKVESNANATKKFYKEPPETYVCFRCGNKGHFIQHCPTNSDRNFDILKIRKPSGIPKDFLVKVQGGDMEKNNAMLVTDDGFVVANPQTQEWKQQGEKYQKNRIPDEYKCAYCHSVLKVAVITNCGHRYCESCIVLDDKCEVCHRIVTKITIDDDFSHQLSSFLKRNR